MLTYDGLRKSKVNIFIIDNSIMKIDKSDCLKYNEFEEIKHSLMGDKNYA